MDEYEAVTFVTGRPDEVVVTLSLAHELVHADCDDVVGYAETSGELIASPKQGKATDIGVDRIDFKGTPGEPRGGRLVVIKTSTATPSLKLRGAPSFAYRLTTSAARRGPT